MKRTLASLILLILAAGAAPSAIRQLPVDLYLEKVRGAWAGQMIGVAYGAPVEFRSCGRIDEGEFPPWTPDRITRALGDDDLYVEISFLEALEKYGINITPEQAGKAFAQTTFWLAHANMQGRENVRKGIMPPQSGSPEFNPHCDDIDFQIESDLFGILNPGLPRSSNAMCETFGRIMNYGDGLYGGMFMSAMYTEAFFESDIKKLVRFGLKSIPAWSKYAQTIRDVLACYHAYPEDWRTTWQIIQQKWGEHPSGRCSKGSFNIDAKLNGAYVVMGLLYGQGDLGKTMEIAARCGQDSDCNPSSAAGILGTVLGYSGIPDEWKSGIPDIANEKFAGSTHSFNTLPPACLSLARKTIERAGGSTREINGREIFFIPAQPPLAPKLEQ